MIGRPHAQQEPAAEDPAVGRPPDRAWRPIPGPVDRESFEDAQRRHRRASWRWTLACAVAVAIMGVPLSAVISPLVVAAITLLTTLVGLVVDTPDLMDPFRDFLSGEAVDPVTLIVPLGVALLIPGAVTLSACWLVVRRLLDEAGTAAELASLGARPAVAGDLEERQLVNVVEEIALAAGIPPPSVHLIDSAVANAATVGSSPTDAAIVVSRGLLDTLGRDETQGVIAHLVGRIGNGDLGIARTIASLYFTLDLVSGLLGAPSNRSTRRAVGQVLRLALRPGTARRHPERMAVASRALFEAQSAGAGEGTDTVSDPSYRSVLLLPVLGAQLAFSLNQMVLSWLLVTPLLKRAWRSRSELADATAVQLTRHPDGVAKGVAQLSEQGGVVPGTEALAHLFVVGREAEERKVGRRQEAQRTEMQSRLADRRGLDKIGVLAAAGIDQYQANEREQRAEARKNESPLVGFHPRLGHRLDRLAAIGATVSFTGATSSAGPLARVVLLVVGGPFVLLFFVLMVALGVAATGVAFALYMLFLVGPVLALDGLIRGQIS